MKLIPRKFLLFCLILAVLFVMVPSTVIAGGGREDSGIETEDEDHQDEPADNHAEDDDHDATADDDHDATADDDHDATADDDHDEMAGDEMADDDHAIHAHGNAAFEQYGLVNSGEGFKEYNVKLSRFAFNPGTIRVDLGDRVILNLDSVDVQHGFYIDGYGLETVVPEEGFQRLEFLATESGSFRIRCASTCGPFHPFMIGRFVVGSNNVFWASIVTVFVLPIGIVAIPRKKKRSTDGNN